MRFLWADDGVKGRRPPAAAALQAALDTIVLPKRMLSKRSRSHSRPSHICLSRTAAPTLAHACACAMGMQRIAPEGCVHRRACMKSATGAKRRTAFAVSMSVTFALLTGAFAQEFPFDRELLLDAAPMRG